MKQKLLLRSYVLISAALLVAAATSLAVGTGSLSEPELRDTFLSLRGYRLAASFLAGSALAVGGVLVQGLFRNPLASPSVLGTTAGANLGGQLALVFWDWFGHAVMPGSRALFLPEMILPFGCLLGAMLALSVLLAFLRVTQDLLALLLVGFILSSLFLSLSSFLTTLSQDSWELGRAVVAFALGSVSGAGPRQLLFALPLLGFGLAAAFSWSRPLDLLLSGEEEAASLGVEVRQVRLWIAVWVSVLVAAAVSLGGSLSFVGLVVPHVLRPFVGVSHRALLPACLLAGGAFVVVCDVITRALPTQGEVPLGVVTGLVGAPVFLVLLLRTRSEESLE
ncbi:MAG: iron ABC transporter permease [Myxococcota bacterium]